MKISLLTLVFVFVGLNGALVAKEVRSNKVRSVVCKSIHKKFYAIKESNCLQGEMNITQVDKLSYQGHQYIVKMQVEAKIDDSSFNVELIRDVDVLSQGITLKSWIGTVTSSVAGDQYTLLRAQHDDRNVQRVIKNDLKLLPKEVLKWKGFMASDFASNQDYEFYNVLNSAGKTIGYIAYVWFESEEEDLKGYEAQNFNLKGKEVGEMRSESWGYNE